MNVAAGVRYNQGSQFNKHYEDGLQVVRQRAPRVHVSYERRQNPRRRDVVFEQRVLPAAIRRSLPYGIRSSYRVILIILVG